MSTATATEVQTLSAGPITGPDTTPLDKRSNAALRNMATDRGLYIPSSYRKAEILAVLRGESAPPVKGTARGVRTANGPTVAELKAECKARGLTGASGLSRDGLTSYLDTGVKPAPKPGTTAALRAECKDRGLKGYSVLRRDDLITYLGTGVRPEPTFNPGTLGLLRQMAKDASIAGRSKMDRTALLCALADAGLADALITNGFDD